jgi:hypothetical protein
MAYTLRKNGARHPFAEILQISDNSNGFASQYTFCICPCIRIAKQFLNGLQGEPGLRVTLHVFYTLPINRTLEPTDTPRMAPASLPSLLPPACIPVTDCDQFSSSPGLPVRYSMRTYYTLVFTQTPVFTHIEVLFGSLPRRLATAGRTPDRRRGRMRPGGSESNWWDY